MTAAETAVGAQAAAAPLRVFRLHIVSRGVPTALLALAVCAVTLRVILHWNPPTAGPGARIFPLLIEAGAASIVGAVTRSPFGESERATGRRLVVLRLVATFLLALVAVGALAVGSATAHLDYGILGLTRDVGGMTGVALIVATVAGGTLSWLGPLSFWAMSTYAINQQWTTPWLWPDRPPHDLDAGLCATVAFLLGFAFATVRGARDSVDD